jgi:hypothetical protein
MPNWMLICPNCSHKFNYSKIDAAAIQASFRDPFRVTTKPDFDAKGEKRRCPGCKVESVFRPLNLYYSEGAKMGL